VAQVETGLPPHLLDRVAFTTLDALPDTLAESTVLVCATAATDPVVSASAVAQAMERRRSPLPLLLVDVAVPRDVAPEVRDVPGVTVIDLDDLAAGCAAEAAARDAALERADSLAREAAGAFAAELRLRAAAPDVVRLRRYADSVRQAALRRARSRLAELTPRQLAAVEQLTHTIVQKLLHPPTVALRDSARLSPAAGRRRRAATLAATLPASIEGRTDDALSA
jgi:glutamyl-tRNA reductase